MKNKALYICVSATLLSISTMTSATPATAIKAPTEQTDDTTHMQSNQLLLNRLEEIKMIDKSELNFQQKRALRKEVREIDKQMQANDGGIYFSVGAIIIILLLLVLLL